MLSKSIVAAAACLLALASASPIEKASQVQERDCPTYAVYVRGTATDTSGTGNAPDPTDPELASIASQAVPGATVTALAYPASGIVNPNDYTNSWGIGIDHLQGLIKYYIQTCPTTKIALFGYSQGASVVSGALYGGQGRPQLPANELAQVKGGAIFADPSWVAGLQPLDGKSTATTNGAFPQSDVQQKFNSGKGQVFRSYCAAGDKYCASGNGPDAQNIHNQEEGQWAQKAIAFVKSLNI